MIALWVFSFLSLYFSVIYFCNDYPDHWIQQPIPKLPILNFHEFPTKSDCFFLFFFSGPNVHGWASGWGVIDPNNKAVQAKKLQKIDVYTMPQRECEDYYDNDGSVTDTMMCAKSYKGI